MKALVFILGRRRKRLMAVTVAALGLAAAAPALAAESHVERWCDAGPVESDTSQTGDVVLGYESSSARRMVVAADVSVFSTDATPRRCGALSTFANTITVEPGTSGLSAGDPVTLRLSVTMASAPEASPNTSESDFIASALRSASLRAIVPDRVVCVSEDGREICRPAELAEFAAQRFFKAEGNLPMPPYPGVARDSLEWGWSLDDNRGPALGDSGTRSLQTCDWPGQFPCLVVEFPPPDPDFAGTRTILVDAVVGDRIELVGAMYVLAQGIFGAADSDGALSAALTPGSGFEGLRLVGELEPPVEGPPAADAEPPTLSVPGAVATNATGASGAPVSYEVTATDNVAEGLTSTCSPASGATFPIGTTIVSCTAVDAAGNTATASFAVTVVGAQGQIVGLIGKTLLFLDRPALSGPLQERLQGAIDAVVARRTAVACTGLRIYALAVLSTRSAFTSAERNELLADAGRIRAVLGCA